MKEKMTKSKIYMIIGISVLVLAIGGSTYAYYAASATANIEGYAAGAGMELEVNKISTSANGDLIPINMDTETLTKGAKGWTGTSVGNSWNSLYACKDKNNNSVCQIYSVTLKNNSSNDQSFNIGITSLSGTNTPHIEAVKMASNISVTSVKSIKGVANGIAENVSIEAGKTSETYYFMVLIENINSEQTDNGSFSGTVTAISSVGAEVKAQFGESDTVYNMMNDSAKTVSDGANARFRSNADLNKLSSVQIDENNVSSSNYTTESGSTVIKLKKEYIATLSNGTHEIKIISSDGYAKSNFEKVNAIYFTIKGNTYSATPGMNWAEWILTYGISSTANNIVWVGLDNSTMYVDIGGHTYGHNPTEILKDSSNNPQTVSSIIQSGMAYNQEECCFDAGSQVLMADGTTKNIENVKVGDYVMSYDTKTGEYAPQKVTHTIIKHNSDDLVYLNLSNGVRIGMRAYHPMLTVNGWKSLRPELAETISDVGHIQKLELNDTLIGINKNVSIVSIDKRDPIANYDTYNFTVDNFHTYIVNGVVVHNANCPT